MVYPEKMCRQHLLGEHRELHTLVGTINKGISLKGYLEKGLIDPSMVIMRHRELVMEMIRRHYNHQTPLPTIPGLWSTVSNEIDVEENLKELCRRCPECKRLITRRSNL